jgi:glycosyltransferase involved in cell wall biosynthesis
MMPMRSKPYPLRTKIHEWLRYCPFNLLVASSEVMAVNIAEFAISRKRISVISNGVDITRFKPVRNIEEKKSIKESLGLKKDARIILFVGSISRRKGVDLLIAAWPEIAGQIPSAYLVLVGPRSAQSEADKRLDSNFIAEIDQSIIKTTFDNRVIFSNYVTNVEQYMRCADVLVFPSRHEGMGNVVAESMASGLACVLTPYVGLPTEFGRPGKEYLLIEPNEKSIASAVINLLEDEEKRSSISLAACEWANKNLDVNHSIHRYAEVYARLNSLVK